MKVFLAGPRAISSLDLSVKDRLNNIIENRISVLIGDANGVDKSIQLFFSDHGYNDVCVYASQGKARNNVGNWPVFDVAVEGNIKGFDYYAAKDIKMAENADYGFMLWNGKSKGTLNNILNLIKCNKKVLVYFTPNGEFYNLKNLENVKRLVALCGDETNKLLESLIHSESKFVTVQKSEQISIFENNR